jgi:hypothetical protein
MIQLVFVSEPRSTPSRSYSIPGSTRVAAGLFVVTWRTRPVSRTKEVVWCRSAQVLIRPPGGSPVDVLTLLPRPRAGRPHQLELAECRGPADHGAGGRHHDGTPATSRHTAESECPRGVLRADLDGCPTSSLHYFIRLGRSGGSVATYRAKTTSVPHDAENSAEHQASPAVKRRPDLQLPRDQRRLLVCSPSVGAPTPLGQGSSPAAAQSRPGFRVSRVRGGFPCCRTPRRDHRLRLLLPQPDKPQRWWDRPRTDHRRKSQSEVLHRPLEPVPESRVGRFFSPMAGVGQCPALEPSFRRC